MKYKIELDKYFKSNFGNQVDLFLRIKEQDIDEMIILVKYNQAPLLVYRHDERFADIKTDCLGHFIACIMYSLGYKRQKARQTFMYKGSRVSGSKYIMT